MTPTQRTLAECKRRNWTAQVVERRIPYSNVTVDLFGCIDIVCLTGSGILGIQATSGTNHSARVQKARTEPRLAKWIADGGRFEVWSFAKRGPRGKTKRWTLRVEEVRL